MEKIKEGNWGAHVLNFIIKGITNYNLKKKKSINGCLFTLMIVYFHLSKNKEKKGEERPEQSWIANWNREQLVERMRAEMDEHMLKLKFILPLSLRLKKTQRNQKGNNPPEQPKKHLLLTFGSEESSPVKKQKTKKKTQRTPQKTQSKKKKLIVEDSSPEQTQSYHGSEIGTEELEEFLREYKKKKNNEKSAAQGKMGADLRSTEDHYDSSKIIPEVNLGSDDPLSQGHTDQSSINKPADSMSISDEISCAGRRCCVRLVGSSGAADPRSPEGGGTCKRLRCLS
ncbi:hypothetical protein AHAS_Ahas16G0005600 [Arachis hypogaea]